MSTEKETLEDFEGFDMDVDIFDESGDEPSEKETEEEKKKREEEEKRKAEQEKIDFGDAGEEGESQDEEGSEEDGSEEDGNEDGENDEEDDEEDESLKTLRTLKQKGVIDLTDEELKDENFDADDALEEKWEEALDNHIRESAENLPDKVKDLIRYANKGGDVNEYLKSMYENSTSPINKDTDISKEENLEKAISEDLKYQGYDDDYIKTHIDTLKKNENLEKVGKTSFNKVLKRQDEKEKEKVDQIKAENKRKKEESKKNREEYEKFVNENNEASGITLTPKMKKELPDYIHNPNVELDNGKKITGVQRDLFKALKDPAKLTALASVIKNDFDFEGLSKKKPTKSNKKQTTKKKPTKGKPKRPVWDDI